MEADNYSSLHLLSLPETVFYTILSHTSISERKNLLLISRKFTSLITKPDFVQERRSNESSDEVLFLVGGSYPDRDVSGPFSRRMGLRDNSSRGLWGYVPSLKSWRMFGGDPRRTPNHPMEHVVDAKPVYCPHPHNCLVLLGGYHRLIGETLDRVVSYSFLTGRWHTWPNMLRKRRGEAFHVLYVQNKLVVVGCSYERCGCSRCMNGMVYWDAMEVAGSDSERSMGMFLDETGAGDDGEGGGQCEMYDLDAQKWTQSDSRAPSCPPKDGGVAALEDRYIILPGTDVEADSDGNARASAVVSDDAASDDGDEMDRSNSTVAEDPNSSSSRTSSVLHRRPGLVYDVSDDKWTTLPSSRSSVTCFPATVAYEDRLLVMGGYRSSGDTILSLFRDGLTVDYEEHVDYCWSYSMADGEWHRSCGGGNGGGDGVKESDVSNTKCCSHRRSRSHPALPTAIPVSVRGASALVYSGRLTLLGGMTTFSQTFHSEERRIIWQHYPEEEQSGGGGGGSGRGSNCCWKPMEFEWQFGKATQVKLPVSALLDTYAFSVHL